MRRRSETQGLPPAASRHLKKRLLLRGQSAEELAFRIETFRRALLVRRGALLRVELERRAAGRIRQAKVYYTLPVAGLHAASTRISR